MSASSSVGPVSGIDYGKLITGLTGPEQSAIDAIGTRAQKIDDQNNAILSLSAIMTGLKVASTSFMTSAIFRSAVATSANSNIITANAGVGTPTGNYTFNVQRLASASQMVTQGFADSSTTALGLSGDITLQLGGGRLDDSQNLAELNGGSGVARGSIRLTDKSGASTLVDLSKAVNIKDVVNAINSVTGVNVQAKIDGDHLVLTDLSGGAGTLSVGNVGGTTTAADLGLTTGAVGSTLTGASITKLNATTSLTSLNDENGVRTAGGVLADFTITGAGGPVSVSLGTAKSVGDVITAINTAGASAGISAAVSADGGGITLTDSGGGPVTVAAQNNSLAAYDLGITGSSAGGTLVGERVASELSGPLLRNLNGGNQGQVGDTLPQAGTITINGETIDLSNAHGLDDVIKQINTNSQGVTAALNGAGTGIVLSSTAASFTVADGTGNLASFLHISGTSAASATGSQIGSGDLRLRYISDGTLLSSLNGGTGFKAGKFRLTDGTGASANIDLSGSGVTKIGDVLKQINNSGLAITARVNDTGDGILLTSTAGTLAGKVEELDGGTTAASLGIVGDFSSGTLNGSFRKTVHVDTTDKLTDIATKINNANAGVAASIISDGSGATPFRLSLSSRNSGTEGRLIFDGSAAGLSTTTLVDGQDAAIVYGGNSDGTGGLVTTSSTNSITGLVPSLTLTLTGTGTTSIAINNDPSKINTAVQGFVDAYNKIIDNIADVTKFDPNDQTKNGILFGNAAVQQVQNALGQFVTKSYTNVGKFRNLADIGITVGQDGKLTLDNDKLTQMIASNPDDVRTLFTTNQKAVTADLTVNPPVTAKPAILGIGITLSNMLDMYTNGQTGQLFDASNALLTQEKQLKDQQTSRTELLTAKKNQMIMQFANLEVSISQFQSQGTSITQMAATLAAK
jgi:flagellar hook-associated protein 2